MPSVAIIEETEAPVVPQDVEIELRDIFQAFSASQAARAPTEEEYADLQQRTMQHFETHLQNVFANDPDNEFLRIESVLRTTRYGENAGIPAERFNIYMEYDSITIYFKNGSKIEDAGRVMQLLKDSITVDYILDTPRKMDGTPFASTVEVYMADILRR